MNMVDVINRVGCWFVDYSLSMLWQCSLLIVVLYLLDLILKKRTRAIVRYGLWMLIMVKLVLPAGIAMPSSPLYWVNTDKAVEVKEIFTTAEDAGDFSEPLVVNADMDIVQESEAAEVQVPEAVSDTIVAVKSSDAGSEPLKVEALILLGWLMVVVLLLGMLMQRFWFVGNLADQAEPVDDRCYEIFCRAKKTMGVKGRVRFGLSANSISPSVCGLVNPMVLISKNMIDDLDEDQLDAVLLHELAHIHRGDLWVNLLQTLLQILYFWHPLLWFANSRIRIIREQAVDEAVMTAMADRADAYPETFLYVSKLAWSRPMLSVRLIGVVESKGAFVNRIKHILGRPLPVSSKIGMAGLASIMIAAAVLLPMAQGQGAEPDFVIHGRVTDAITGHPVAGVHVGDAAGYNNGSFFAVTDADGYYSYKSWYEEHNISAKADGYETAGSLLTTNVFERPGESEINFALSLVDELILKAKKYVAAFFENNFRDVTKRTDISWSQPIINEAGNIVVDYKYEARIWDQYSIISNQRFEYTQAGEFVKYTDIISMDDFDSVENLVVKFFNNNYRDITSRKDIEWGKPYADKDGNICLRYKYEATIWDKDKIVQDKVFTFTPEGKYVMVVDYVEPVSRSTGNISNNGFEAELSNGVKIKILGVCSNPSVGKQWWMPDGSVSDVKSDKVYGRNVSSPGERYYIQYEIDDFKDGMDVRYSASGCNAASDEKECKGAVCDGVLTLNMDRGKKTTSLSIGIAAGEWKKLTRFGKNSSRGAYGVGGDSFMYGEVVELDGKTRISVSYSVNDRQIRLAAIGKDGKEYIGSSCGSTTMNGMTMGEYEFAGLGKDDVDEFEFQVRDYEWVDFKNISLRAGEDMGFTCGSRVAGDPAKTQSKPWSAVKNNMLGCWQMTSYKGDEEADIKGCVIEFKPDGNGSMVVTEGDKESSYGFSYHYESDNKVIAETDYGKLTCLYYKGELVVLTENAIVIEFRKELSTGVVQNVPAGLQEVVSAFCRSAAADDLDGVLTCFDPSGEDYNDIKTIMTADEGNPMYEMKKMFLAIDPDKGLEIISTKEDAGKTKVVWRVKFAKAFEVEGHKFDEGSTYELAATLVKTDDGRWLIDNL